MSLTDSTYDTRGKARFITEDTAEHGGTATLIEEIVLKQAGWAELLVGLVVIGWGLALSRSAWLPAPGRSVLINPPQAL